MRARPNQLATRQQYRGRACEDCQTRCDAATAEAVELWDMPGVKQILSTHVFSSPLSTIVGELDPDGTKIGRVRLDSLDLRHSVRRRWRDRAAQRRRSGDAGDGTDIA